MNVIERDAARAAGSAIGQPDKPTAPEPTERRKLRPLLSLMPYLARYRWRAIAALVVLVIAAITTLVVPIAVRRMIDFGFAQRGCEPDRQLFCRPDRHRGRSRSVERGAFLSRHHAGRTDRGRSARGRVRPPDLALARLLRCGQDRRTDLAAHRRYHADQGRRGCLDFRCIAQRRSVRGRERHDGRDQPEAFRLCARGDPRDRPAALRLRPRGAPALACGAGHARRRHRLCIRTARCGARAASLHQRGAGQQPFRCRGRARIRRRARLRSGPALSSPRLPSFSCSPAWSWCSGSARRTYSPAA